MKATTALTRHAIGDLPQTLVDRWNALLLASPVRSAFLSHAFCAAVNRVRGGVFVLHIKHGGGEGFLPFQIRKGRRLLGHAEKAGGSLSDFFGIVGDLPGRIDAQALLEAAGLSSLRFDHAIPEMCPFSFDDRESGSGARLNVSSYGDFTKRLLETNKTFIKSVQSRERRVGIELGSISFRWNVEKPAEALDRLISAKRAQYRRTGVSDALGAAWHRKVLAELLRKPAIPACAAIISTLHAGEHWLASKLSLVCGDTLHSWFSVYDPQYRRHGPGHLLWFKTIEEGSRRGIGRYDFGEGESGYKAEYGGESYDVLKGVIRKNTLLGHSERALQSLHWRVQALKRRRPKPAGSERRSGDG